MSSSIIYNPSYHIAIINKHMLGLSTIKKKNANKFIVAWSEACQGSRREKIHSIFGTSSP